MPRPSSKSKKLKVTAPRGLGQVQVFYPAIKIPQPNGDLLIRAGKPVVLSSEDEITTTEAADILGCTLDWVGRMCDRGTLIEGEDWRRIGERGSYRIKRSSILKLRDIKEA